MTGNSYSIAPYEVTQYSKAAQTEAFEEQDYEEANVTDEEDTERQRGEETGKTEITQTDFFPIIRILSRFCERDNALQCFMLTYDCG